MAKRPRPRLRSRRCQLWPETPAVENERQPFVLMRSLAPSRIRSLKAVRRRTSFRRISCAISGFSFIALPRRSGATFAMFAPLPACAERRRSARVRVSSPTARALRISSIGDCSGALWLMARAARRMPRRCSRMTDARSLDPALGGMLALIQGVLFAKSDPKKAIVYFDDARLLSPERSSRNPPCGRKSLLLAKEGRYGALRRAVGSVFAPFLKVAVCQHFPAPVRRRVRAPVLQEHVGVDLAYRDRAAENA